MKTGDPQGQWGPPGFGEVGAELGLAHSRCALARGPRWLSPFSPSCLSGLISGDHGAGVEEPWLGGWQIPGHVWAPWHSPRGQVHLHPCYPLAPHCGCCAQTPLGGHTFWVLLPTPLRPPSVLPSHPPSRCVAAGRTQSHPSLLSHLRPSDNTQALPTSHPPGDLAPRISSDHPSPLWSHMRRPAGSNCPGLRASEEKHLLGLGSPPARH